MKRAFQIAFLREQGLESHHRLLDLGCGTLRGGIPIIEFLHPGHYSGVDVRADVLSEARRELDQAGLADKQPLLVLAEDIAALELADEYDYVWAFSVLIHMGDDTLRDALALVARHLAPAGRFFANVSIADRVDGAWQSFPVVHRSLDFYRAAAANQALAMEDLGTLDDLGHHTGRKRQDMQRMLRFTRA